MSPAAARAARGLALASVVLLLPSACGGSGSGDDARTNVLLATLDTTRADFLSAYGAGSGVTPHFDRVASEGTRFDMAVSTASVTPVSHAAILTGRRNRGHGLRVLTALGGYRLPADVPTLTTLLAAEGYRTAAIHSAFPVSSYFGFERGFELFDDVDTEFVPMGPVDRVGWDVGTFQRRSDETSDRAIEFLRRTTKPFFLWIHYWDPHDDDKKPPGIDSSGIVLYQDEVRYMDEQFGRVLAALRDEGLEDRTIVAIVSDHGQGLQDHDWRGHRILYQEQIHVPLLLRVPGVEQTPVVPDLVSTVDLLPTLLDYLAIDEPPGVEGRSLRPLIEGGRLPARIAFADQVNRFDQNAHMVEIRPKDSFLYLAMDRDWKLIYRPMHPDESELYHLASDPRELHDVHAEHPDQVLRLMKELAHEAPWVTEPFPPYEDAGDRDSALQALSQLGYAAGSGEASDEVIPWTWTCPDPAHADDPATGDAPGTCSACGTPTVPVVR